MTAGIIFPYFENLCQVLMYFLPLITVKPVLPSSVGTLFYVTFNLSIGYNTLPKLFRPVTQPKTPGPVGVVDSLSYVAPIVCWSLFLVLLLCQSRVTVTSCFVYKVIRDLESINHVCINPIHRIGLIHQ